MSTSDRNRVAAAARELGGAPGTPNVWALLNAIDTILGSTKRAFWPGFENTGTTVRGYAATDLTTRDAGSNSALEAEWAPQALRASQLYTYRNLATNDGHFTAGDDADYSHGNATVDTAFSCGMWIAPSNITTVALMAKYNTTAAEEWAFRIDASSNLQLELHDASASATEIGLGSDTIELYKMQFVVATYDGTETAPVVKFYLNGVHDGGTGATTESGSYVAMENTVTPLLIAASNVITAPAEEYSGWLALPFQTGKELTAIEVMKIYEYTRVLVGA